MGLSHRNTACTSLALFLIPCYTSPTMRVIAGESKGRRLAGPKTIKIRPALDAVREAIFNILGNIRDTSVLDLFAGTGSVGIEALSRGAQKAIFIDHLQSAVFLIRKNLALCHFENRAEVHKKGVSKALPLLSRRGLRFDLIFVDPPYDQDLVGPTLDQISREKILAHEGWIVVEHSPRESINEIEGLCRLQSRQYGQTYITFLQGSTLII